MSDISDDESIPDNNTIDEIYGNEEEDEDNEEIIGGPEEEDEEMIGVEDDDEEMIGGENDDEEMIGGAEDDDDDEEYDDDEDDNEENIITKSQTKLRSTTPKKNSSPDSDDDNEDDSEEKYLQKFDSEINKNYVYNYHPECVIHNYDEILALTKIVRDSDNIIIDPLHRTLPFLTKYERVRILGERTKQLSLGAKSMIRGVGNMDPKEVAKLELKKKVIPLIIIRSLPSGRKEKWKITELSVEN